MSSQENIPQAANSSQSSRATSILNPSRLIRRLRTTALGSSETNEGISHDDSYQNSHSTETRPLPTAQQRHSISLQSPFILQAASSSSSQPQISALRASDISPIEAQKPKKREVQSMRITRSSAPIVPIPTSFSFAMGKGVSQQPVQAPMKVAERVEKAPLIHSTSAPIQPAQFYNTTLNTSSNTTSSSTSSASSSLLPDFTVHFTRKVLNLSTMASNNHAASSTVESTTEKPRSLSSSRRPVSMKLPPPSAPLHTVSASTSSNAGKIPGSFVPMAPYAPAPPPPLLTTSMQRLPISTSIGGAGTQPCYTQPQPLPPSSTAASSAVLRSPLLPPHAASSTISTNSCIALSTDQIMSAAPHNNHIRSPLPPTPLSPLLSPLSPLTPSTTLTTPTPTPVTISSHHYHHHAATSSGATTSIVQPHSPKQEPVVMQEEDDEGWSVWTEEKEQSSHVTMRKKKHQQKPRQQSAVKVKQQKTALMEEVEEEDGSAEEEEEDEEYEHVHSDQNQKRLSSKQQKKKQREERRESELSTMSSSSLDTLSPQKGHHPNTLQHEVMQLLSGSVGVDMWRLDESFYLEDHPQHHLLLSYANDHNHTQHNNTNTGVNSAGTQPIAVSIAGIEASATMKPTETSPHNNSTVQSVVSSEHNPSTSPPGAAAGAGSSIKLLLHTLLAFSRLSFLLSTHLTTAASHQIAYLTSFILPASSAAEPAEGGENELKKASTSNTTSAPLSYLTALFPYTQHIAFGCEVLFTVLLLFCEISYLLSHHLSLFLQPYRIEILLDCLFGCVLTFFGGHFTMLLSLLAALQATTTTVSSTSSSTSAASTPSSSSKRRSRRLASSAPSSSGGQMSIAGRWQSSLLIIKEELEKVMTVLQAFEAEDMATMTVMMADTNNSTASTVNTSSAVQVSIPQQISPAERSARQLQQLLLVFASIDPQRFTQALLYLSASCMAVIMALRFSISRTIAMGHAISKSVEPTVQLLVERLLTPSPPTTGDNSVADNLSQQQSSDSLPTLSVLKSTNMQSNRIAESTMSTQNSNNNRKSLKVKKQVSISIDTAALNKENESEELVTIDLSNTTVVSDLSTPSSSSLPPFSASSSAKTVTFSSSSASAPSSVRSTSAAATPMPPFTPSSSSSSAASFSSTSSSSSSSSGAGWRRWLVSCLVKVIAMSIAWQVRGILTSFYSAFRGSRTVITSLLTYLVHCKVLSIEVFNKQNTQMKVLRRVLCWSLCCLGLYWQYRMARMVAVTTAKKSAATSVFSTLYYTLMLGSTGIGGGGGIAADRVWLQKLHWLVYLVVYPCWCVEYLLRWVVEKSVFFMPTFFTNATAGVMPV